MRLRMAVVAALTLMANAALADEPVPVRLGWSVMPGELAPVIFTKPDLAKHNGKSYAFGAVRIAASPQMITALAAKEIDIAALAFSSFPIAVLNAGMTDLRVIADESQDGAPGYYTDEFKIRNDSAIKSVEDLKGKVLASTGFGAASDIALRAMLVQHKMDPAKDATIIQVAYPNMKSFLKEQKADLVVAIPPFAFDPELNQFAHTLFTGKDAMGPTQKIFWVARADFLQKNHAALVDFVEDFYRAERWFMDPANRTESLAIISAFTKQPPETYDGYLYTKSDYFRDPRGLPNLDALQHSIDIQAQLGLLKKTIDVKQMTDLSIVTEAVTRLP